MAIITKPDTNLFASTAQLGEVENYPDIGRGFGIMFEMFQGIPPMEMFNHLMKRLDEKDMYLWQQGISEWASDIDYPQYAIVKFNGNLYQANQANVNKSPGVTLNQAIWEEWSVKKSDLNGLLSGKANINHNHAWSEISGKPSTFTPSTHSHQWSEILGKPSTFTPSTHSHQWSEILGKPSTFTPSTHSHQWSEISGKPSTFTPSTHSHQWSEILGAPATATRWPTWSEVSGKPSTFTPSTHSHTMAQISDLPKITRESQANTIVQRDSGADVSGRTFRATYNDENYCNGAVAFRVNNSDDNHTRYCNNPSAVRSWLGLHASVTRAADWGEITNKPAQATRWPNAVEQGYSHSLGANGWCKLPNGLILQWGERTNAGTHNFPIAFTSECYQVILSDRSYSDIADYLSLTDMTRTNFTTYARNIGAFIFFAIGR